MDVAPVDFHSSFYIKDNKMRFFRRIFQQQTPTPLPAIDFLEVDFESLTKKQRKEFLEQLPIRPIKSLKLKNCNVFNDGCCADGSNYITTIFRQLLKNPFIETLQLDKEFISTYFSYMYREQPRYQSSGSGNILLQRLLGMHSLKTLIIPVPGEVNFKHLEEYLTDPDCRLESLELISGITVQQLED
jgi:hypothetical protein